MGNCQVQRIKLSYFRSMSGVIKAGLVHVFDEQDIRIQSSQNNTERDDFQFEDILLLTTDSVRQFKPPYRFRDKNENGIKIPLSDIISIYQVSGSSQRNSLNKLLLVTERRTLSIATRCENEMHNWLLTFKKILKEFQIMHPEIKSHETLSNTDSIIDINNCNNETSLELYFNRFTCGLDLLKDFAPQLVNYHSRFSKSYQNECSIISDEINTPLQERILMEVKRNFGMSKIELDECLENLKVHEKCVIDYSELMDQLSSIQARVHCKKLTHLDLKKTQHQAFRLSCTRDVILNLCRSCGISKINSVFKECGHFVFCNTCALQLIAEGKECPYCSAPIRSIIKVYEC